MNLFDKTQVYANYLLHNTPDGVAKIKGSKAYPALQGTVSFYQVKGGVLAAAQIRGLPTAPQGECAHKVFALHIHDGKACTGNAADPFADAGMHYNPANQPHPCHAGDLPPLFSNDGTAWFVVLTNRFKAVDVIGKAVIVHDQPDDFKTQPSGASGTKIGCGIIHAK